MKMQSGTCLVLLAFAAFQAAAQDAGIIGEKGVIGEKPSAEETTRNEAGQTGSAGKQTMHDLRGMQLRKGALVAPAAQQPGLAPRPSAAREPGDHGNVSPKDPTPADPKGPPKLATQAGLGDRGGWVAGKDEPKEPKEPKDPKGPDKLSNQALRSDAVLQKVAPARNMEAARSASGQLQGQP